jgi:hypothetical protein
VGTLAKGEAPKNEDEIGLRIRTRNRAPNNEHGIGEGRKIRLLHLHHWTMRTWALDLGALCPLLLCLSLSVLSEAFLFTHKSIGSLSRHFAAPYEPQSTQQVLQNTINKHLKSAISILGTTALISSISPNNAFADSLEDANNKLAGYGLPPILYLPPGLSPLVSEYGRGNIRQSMSNPIVVQFAYPRVWVVQKTSVNNNGEAGTISANGR